MPDDVRIDVISDQQQHSSIGVGEQEKSTPITDLLDNKVAKMLGLLVCGWVVLVLVQGGMVGTLETKDCVFVTLLFFLVFFRCWRHYCPEAYRSLIEATQSLSADYLSIPNNKQQLALPACYIDTLLYCSRLVFAMTSVVLSVMRLASQDFGKKELANKESRDFALKVFYGLTLAEALVLLFAEALSFAIRENSVGLADGPGDGLEVGLITMRNSVGLADGPGDGAEDGLITRGNSVGLVDGPGDSLEVGLITRGNSVGLADGLGDGPEDGLITRGNSVGLADRPGDGPKDGLITRGNSMGLADGPGDGLEVGLITRGNSVGLADGLGDGPEDGLITRGNSVGLADELGDGLIIRGNSVGLAGGPGDGLEVGLITRGNSVGIADGPGDRPVNQSNECNGVRQISLPANQSNDFNSEGLADSLPNLRQRRREIPPQKIVIKLSMANARKRTKALKAAAKVDGVISKSIDGDKILVEGYGIDPVALTTVLRKRLGYADLISVTSGEDNSVKPVVIPYPYAYHEVSQDPDSCSIMGNSVGLVDGPGDRPEDGLITRENSVGLADGPGDGLEVGLITRGNSMGLADGPVNQSNECNGVAQMSLPANQSNDFNSEGLADSLPNLRQRRREIPPQKIVIKLSMENTRKRTKALKAAARVDGVISKSIDGDKIVVEGYGIDSVALTTVLRKRLGYADLISVTSGEDKSAKLVVIPYPYGYSAVNQDPVSCSIM